MTFLDSLVLFIEAEDLNGSEVVENHDPDNVLLNYFLWFFMYFPT